MTFARRGNGRLAADPAGSAAVEFALLGPLVIVLLLGVLQVGMAMHAYNSLRSIAADTARHVTVEYQKANRLTNSQIQAFAIARAIQPPYMLRDEGVAVEVATVTPSRVSGVREISLTVSYTVPSVLGIIDLPSYQIDFTRPIFVPA